MKTKNTFFRLLILLGYVCAFFIGCSDGDDDDDTNYGVGSPHPDQTIVATTTTKYYSLAGGTLTEVTGAAIASKGWDIAFKRSRLIYTNSGVTATETGSGGLGGVWYTDKTDFSNVSDKDAVTSMPADYAGLNTDTTKYVAGMSSPTATVMNVMTYVGYAEGTTGTQDNPYGTIPYDTTEYPQMPPTGYLPYAYNKKHAVQMTEMMTGKYGVTNQVYIIRHGTGDKYSKIQITDYTSSTANSTDTYEITVQNFEANYGVGSPKPEQSIVATTTTKYYSLAGGTLTEVTGDAINSKNWDIAFKRSRLIYTNSGVTATTLGSGGSGGLGGVWYTDKTDFSKVSDKDAVTSMPADYAGLNADTTKYTAGMNGATATVMNVMTYVGYAEGTDGTEDNPYGTIPYDTTQYPTMPPEGYLPYAYNKKHAVQMTEMMTGKYGVTNQVYIIKHGTGDKYSKIQITDYTSSTANSTDTYEITVQNF